LKYKINDKIINLKKMQSAINVPQSKSVTIAFLGLKVTIFILIVTSTVKSMAQS
jgi:hypothetical protein